MSSSERRTLALPIDHVGWLVDDLESAVGDFREMGFTVTPPAELHTEGVSSRSGQRSAHVMFADTYLELTQYWGEPPGHLAPYAAYPGLKILALAVENADDAHGSIAGSKTSVTGSSRKLAYSGGVTAEFRWFMCEPAASPQVLVCFVEHLSRSSVFDESVTQHRNGGGALSDVWVVSEDPDAEIEMLLGLVTEQNAQGRVHFLTKPAAREHFGPELHCARPGIVAVTMTVSDENQFKDCLSKAGIALRGGPSLSWFPGPHGTAIALRAPDGTP